MDLDEPVPSSRRDPVATLIAQDLAPLSRDELVARIAGLEAEIARCRARLAAASEQRRDAEALFGKRL